MLKHLFLAKPPPPRRRGPSASRPDTMPRIRWYA